MQILTYFNTIRAEEKASYKWVVSAYDSFSGTSTRWPEGVEPRLTPPWDNGLVRVNGLRFWQGVLAVAFPVSFILLSYDLLLSSFQVTIVGLIGGCHTCFTVVGEYNTFVQNYGSPMYLLDIHCASAFVATIMQKIDAYRIYILSNRKILLPMFVVFLTLVHFGFGTFTTGWAWLFLMAGTDLLITATIVVLLAQRRSDFHRTNSIIDDVILYTVTNNGLTAAAAISSSIMFQAGPRLWHIIPGKIIIKLYSRSLLASLNSRQGLAQELTRFRTGAILGSRLCPTFSFCQCRAGSVGKASRTAASIRMRDHGETSFPVRVTLETSSTEYRTEELAWEEKDGERLAKNVVAEGRADGHGAVGTTTPVAQVPTLELTNPPSRNFVEEPDFVFMGLETETSRSDVLLDCKVGGG
ncbi:BQ2448_5091 [Microbotryum intermedium]|uniref:BQ2448_5091 protein n=1 Tax=Microbotryum intermedium TaxID=269621 RepID=A0A238F030_9BASI|nr:BQ2448_5091 [Microbotryum intermedium]